MRQVDEEFLAGVAEIVQAPVRFDIGREYLNHLDAADGYAFDVRPDTIRAFLPVKDLFGNESFYLTIDTQRALNQTVRNQLVQFLSLLAVIVVLFVILASFGVNRLVVWRLKKLDSFMKLVRFDIDLPEKMTVSGDDELSRVAVSMNQMLERIAASRQEIRQLNAALQEELAERKRAEAILQYSSQHDILTGLYNRSYLEETLHRIMKSGANGVGVVCCDLDGLKLINDTLGHAAGDLMLQKTAEVLQKAAPPDALAVRSGGDEFLIVLTGIQESELDAVGERIHSACTLAGQMELPLQISVGWRYKDVCAPNSVDLDQLIKEADNEMYRQKLSSRQSARGGVVQAIMKMLEVRNFDTEEHSQRLESMATGLADRVGLPEHRRNDLRLLAKFHDIGKIGIPDSILLKPGPLTPDERREMEYHPEIGRRIAAVIPELHTVADLILKHHERWDGAGYPLGLREQEIPLENRILAVVDAFDAMTSDRPYRQAMTQSVALAEIQRCAASQFDPFVAAEFAAMMTDNTNGSAAAAAGTR